MRTPAAVLIATVALAAGLRAQDQNLPPQDLPPAQRPEAPKAEDSVELSRLKIHRLLSRILLERFMEPWDLMALDGTLTKERVKSDYDQWYMLLIRSDNPLRDKDIWIAFQLFKGSAYEEGGWDSDSIRLSLLGALEHHVVILLGVGDMDVIRTLQTGTAHIYRMVTSGSTPESLRKEDLVK